LLTARGPTSYRSGEERPRHYLDYFHAGLVASPGGSWLADSGWIWHPSGRVATWSAQDWLDGNVWESEDGPTKRYLCQRDYLWDTSMCWLDETTLAVWGIGNDELDMIPGVVVYDVITGSEIRTFTGPEGFLFHERGWLLSSAQDGLTIWDSGTGDRLARVPGFRPTRHHPTAHELVEVRHDRLVRWRL
jgi:hypothetical protein